MNNYMQWYCSTLARLVLELNSNGVTHMEQIVLCDVTCLHFDIFFVSQPTCTYH